VNGTHVGLYLTVCESLILSATVTVKCYKQGQAFGVINNSRHSLSVDNRSCDVKA